MGVVSVWGVSVNVLVLNCGSSSLKFQVITTSKAQIAEDKDTLLAKGLVERIGSQAIITIEVPQCPPFKKAMPLKNHKAAIEWLLNWMVDTTSLLAGITKLADIHAVGHRIVHGGEKFRRSVMITDEVLRGIEECMELAPLHNPANISGIRAIREILGSGVPQVGVFDTAFHADMPETEYLYAIPYQYYRRYRVRRYGFHGTSHRYVAYRYRQLKCIPKDQVNIITLHLGNGASACAIKGGVSVATSMGMTPLPGLVMGTRSGDIDPAIIDFMAHKEGLSLPEIDTMLNKQSGLLGISGITHDMRELLDEERENGDRRARLAIDIFCQKVLHYIGAYWVVLGGADAIVFAGGIGENASVVRERILAQLSCFGVELDPALNQKMVQGREGAVTTAASRVPVYVIPTNEELLIARDTVRCI